MAGPGASPGNFFFGKCRYKGDFLASGTAKVKFPAAENYMFLVVFFYKVEYYGIYGTL